MKKLIMAMVIGTTLLAGCGSASTADSGSADSTTTDSSEQELTGSVTMNGSTSMEKLATSLAESFMEKYPGVTATAEFTGSSSGIESVAAGSVDIGNSSRSLKDEELEKGLVENIVAIDGIAIVTDVNNTAEDLTTDQLIKIYTGEITDWSEVGGEAGSIVVIGREAGSGTRGAFEEILGIEDMCAYAQELDSTGAIIAKVSSISGAIGYVSLDVVDDTVKALKLDGVEATEENIKSGDYTLSRPFVMATRGEISEQSEAVQAFFEYIDSDEGQEIVKNVGLISAK